MQEVEREKKQKSKKIKKSISGYEFSNLGLSQCDKPKFEVKSEE
jgi:hypothetical protein